MLQRERLRKRLEPLCVCGGSVSIPEDADASLPSRSRDLLVPCWATLALLGGREGLSCSLCGGESVGVEWWLRVFLGIVGRREEGADKVLGVGGRAIGA